MKTLLTLRHAKSAWDDPGLADFDRPLAASGRRDASLIAEYLARHGPRPDIVLCSSARRTVDTWTCAAPAFKQDIPVSVERELYLANMEALLERLRLLDDGIGTALLIGHNPGLGQLAATLAGEGDLTALKALRRKYPTAALAILACDAAHWRDLGPGRGRLVRYVRPADLRPGSRRGAGP